MEDSKKMMNLQEESWKKFFTSDIDRLVKDASYEDSNCEITYHVRNARDFARIPSVTTISDGTVSDQLKFDINIELKNNKVDTKSITIEDKTLISVPLLTSSGMYIQGTQYGIRSNSGLAPGWYMEQTQTRGTALPIRDKGIVKRGFGDSVFSVVYKSAARDELKIYYRGSSFKNRAGFYVKLGSRGDKEVSLWTFLKALSQNEDMNTIYDRLNKLPIFKRDLLRFRSTGYGNGASVEPTVEECAKEVMNTFVAADVASSSYTKRLHDRVFRDNKYHFSKNRNIRLKTMCGFNAGIGEQLADDVYAKDEQGEQQLLLTKGTTLTAEDIVILDKHDVDKIAIVRDKVKVNLFVVSIKDKATFNEFISVTYYLGLYIMGFGKIDEKEDFKNKVIKNVSEIISNHISRSLQTVTNAVIKSIETNSSTQIIKSIEKGLGEVYRNQQLQSVLIEDKTSNMRDETNSIAAFEESFRTTGNKDLGKDPRAVNKYHQGRICSFTTPESKPVGIALSMTYGSRIVDGYVSYPVLLVQDGKSIDKQVYLTSDMEENKIIAPADIDLSNDGNMDEIIVGCRQNGESVNARRRDIHYQDSSVLNSISPILLFVPSLNRNAGKRLTMAANAITQARQPVLRNRPWLSTGVETCMKVNYVTARDIVTSALTNLDKDSDSINRLLPFIEYIKLESVISNIGKNAVANLVTEDSDTAKISVSAKNDKNGDGCTSTLTFKVVLQEGKEANEAADWIWNNEFDGSSERQIIYHISSMQPTAVHNAVKHQRIRFVGNHVINDKELGESCYGLDEIVIVSNDNDCKEYKLAKDEVEFGIDKHKTNIIKDSSLAFGNNVKVLFKGWSGYGYEDSVVVNESFAKKYGLATTSLFRIKSEAMQDVKGAEKVSIRETKNEKFEELPDVQNGKYLKPGQTVIKKISEEHNGNRKEYPIKVQVGQGGVVYNQFDITKEKKTQDGGTSYTTVTRNVILADLSTLSPGDKVGGLHGNKGVVGKIVPEEDLPYTEHGIPDIVLNPLGVISRTNIGQLVEALLGMVGYNTEVIQFLEPFSSMTIDEMITHAKECGIDEVDVYDGRTGRKFERKAFMGNMYFMRSTHMSTSLHNACGLESINRNPASKQTIKGKGGGQRISEILANAFRAHNATAVLDSLFTVQSDDEEALRMLIAKLKRDVREDVVGKALVKSQSEEQSEEDLVTVQVGEPTEEENGLEKVPINYQNIKMVQAYFRSLGVSVEKQIKDGKEVNGFRPITNEDVEKMVSEKYRLRLSSNASMQNYGTASSISAQDSSTNKRICDTQYFAIELPDSTPVVMPLVCYNSAFLRMFIVRYVIVTEKRGRISVTDKYKYMSTTLFKQLLYGGNILLNVSAVEKGAIPIITNKLSLEIINGLENKDYLFTKGSEFDSTVVENAKRLAPIACVFTKDTQTKIYEYLKQTYMNVAAFSAVDSDESYTGLAAIALRQSGEYDVITEQKIDKSKAKEKMTPENKQALGLAAISAFPREDVRHASGIEAIMCIFTNFDTRITVAVTEKVLRAAFVDNYRVKPEIWMPKYRFEPQITSLMMFEEDPDSFVSSDENLDPFDVMCSEIYTSINAITDELQRVNFLANSIEKVAAPAYESDEDSSIDMIGNIIGDEESASTAQTEAEYAMDGSTEDEVDNLEDEAEQEEQKASTHEEEVENNIRAEMMDAMSEIDNEDYINLTDLDMLESEIDASVAMINTPAYAIKSFNRLCTIRTTTLNFFRNEMSTDGKRDIEKFKKNFVVKWVLIPPVCFRPRFNGRATSPIDSALSSVYTHVADYDTRHDSFFYKKLFEMVSKSAKDAREGKKTVLEMITSHANRNSKIRDTLFAKRVVGSGRSVIIVDPRLNLGECGLPLTIASTMFETLTVEKLKIVTVENDTTGFFSITSELIRRKRSGAAYLSEDSSRYDKIYHNTINWLSNSNYDTFIDSLLNDTDTHYMSKYNTFLECQRELVAYLDYLMTYYPILLNREPSLHKFNIMSFQGHVIDGHAISLHPLACRPYNADFDGDQMGCYVVFEDNAIVEAKAKMDQRVNLTNPKDGKLIVELNQDMILGIYWMTMLENNWRKSDSKLKNRPSIKNYLIYWNKDNINNFNDYRSDVFNELWADIDLNKIKIQDIVTVVLENSDDGSRKIYKDTVGRIILNSLIHDGLGFTENKDGVYNELRYSTTIDKGSIKTLLVDLQDMFVRYSQQVTDAASKDLYANNSYRFCEVLDRLKNIGFHMADRSGISISVFDFNRLSASQELLALFARITSSGIKKINSVEDKDAIVKLLDPMREQLVEIGKKVVSFEAPLAISDVDEIEILMNAASYVKGKGINLAWNGENVNTTLERASIAVAAGGDVAENISILGAVTPEGVANLVFKDFTVLGSKAKFKKVMRSILNAYIKCGIRLDVARYNDLEDTDPASIEESARDAMHKKMAIIDAKFKEGRLTDERKVALISRETKVYKDIVTNDIKDALEFMRNSNIYIMTNSGARGDIGSLTQVCGMIGMTGDGKGGSISTPIEGNLLNGMNYNDLFKFSYNARSILVNTQLDIPRSGAANRDFSYTTEYLTIRPDTISEGSSGYEETDLFGSGGNLDVLSGDRVVDTDGVKIDHETHCDGESVWMPLTWNPKISNGTKFVFGTTVTDAISKVLDQMDADDRQKWMDISIRYFRRHKSFVLTDEAIELIRSLNQDASIDKFIRFSDGKTVRNINELRRGQTILIDDFRACKSVVSELRYKFLSMVSPDSQIKKDMSDMHITKAIALDKKTGEPMIIDVKYSVDKVSVMSVMYRSIDLPKFTERYPELEGLARELCFDKRAEENPSIRIAFVISKEFMNAVEKTGVYVESVPIYTIVNCKHKDHICRRCYGMKYDTAQIPSPNETVGFQGVQAICSTLSQMILDTHKSANGSEAQDSMVRINSIMKTEVDLKPRMLDDYRILVNSITSGIDSVPVMDSDESEISSVAANSTKNVIRDAIKGNALRYIYESLNAEEQNNVITKIEESLFDENTDVVDNVFTPLLAKDSQLAVLYMRMSVWMDLIQLLSSKDVLARNSEMFPKAIIDCGVALASDMDDGVFAGSVYRISKLVESGVPFAPRKLSSGSSIACNEQVYASIFLSHTRENLGKSIISGAVDRGSIIGKCITGTDDTIFVKTENITTATRSKRKELTRSNRGQTDVEVPEDLIQEFELSGADEDFAYESFDDTDAFGGDLGHSEFDDFGEVSEFDDFGTTSAFDDFGEESAEPKEMVEPEGGFENTSAFDDLDTEEILESNIEDAVKTEEPIVEKSAMEGPVIGESVMEEPVIDESVTAKSIMEEPVAEESATEEPVIEEFEFRATSAFTDAASKEATDDSTSEFTPKPEVSVVENEPEDLLSKVKRNRMNNDLF